MKPPGRGEFQIIEFLKERSRSAPGLIQGIGDDCAVISIPAGEELLTTTDLLTEGVHFNRDWSDMLHLGRKAVAVNVSDLASMGARPLYLFLSLAIPDQIEDAELDQFLAGFLQACEAYGMVLAGGDTCRSRAGLTISVTAQGSSPASAWVSRSGACINNDIYVTGTLGDSALALQELLAGHDPDPFLKQRHIDPLARVSSGLALARAVLATAMIDISDGLLGDLEHILTASAVGAVVELDQLPFSEQFRRELDKDPGLLKLALVGGEDYELLFTAPSGSAAALGRIAEQTAVSITCIGRIVEKEKALRVFSAGVEVDLPVQRGYKHFPEST